MVASAQGLSFIDLRSNSIVQEYNLKKEVKCISAISDVLAYYGGER